MSRTLPKHQWVETEDGSLTLFSEEFGEACHSSSGAKTETLLHYVKGCQVVERLGTHSPFTILEVGFGLGLGYVTTAEALSSLSHPWKFVSLEIDRDLITWFQQSHPELKETSPNIFESETLTVIVGDARKVFPEYLKKHPLKFHAIYQDAFSPRRNPVLWTKEWFTLLRECSAGDVILSTYSSSSSIRKSLLEAGWKLRKGEKFGPKRSSTRATLSGESDEEILLHLSRSPVGALTDETIEEFLNK